MRAINESQLQLSLDSGSTKRLKSFRKRLRADNPKVVFDDKAVNLLFKYAREPNMVQDVLAYLNHLTDDDGVPFARSIKQYEKMQEVWRQFSHTQRSPFTWNEHYQIAEAIVAQRYAKAKLKPLIYLNDSDIEDALTELSTSTGWTSIVDGKPKKRDIISGSAEKVYLSTENALREGSFNRPMLPGVRTQCSGEFDDEGNFTYTCTHKTRPIWMVDVIVVIVERMYAKPLTEWLKTYAYSAVGKNDFDIARRISNMRLKFSYFMSLDYSKYDSSIPSWLIHSAFKVLANAFIMDDYQRDVLKVLEEDFINKNLITAEGVEVVNHGNPSGSGLTTIINGICNEILTETWADYCNMRGQLQYMIMGDDNLIYYRYPVEKEIVGSYLLHNFGITINVDKTSQGGVNDDPEFLSRRWTIHGPYRHPHEIISRLAFPEKFRDYHGDLTPELVIYSYLLAYPVGMEKLIDTHSFLRDFGPRLRDTTWSAVPLNQIPYYVRLALETDVRKPNPRMMLKLNA